VRERTWCSLAVWCAWFPFFAFYVAAEVGIANWISPFATLRGLASDADAALLATVYYSAFAAARLLAAPLSRRVPSAVILGGALGGALASTSLLLYAGGVGGVGGGAEGQPTEAQKGALWAAVSLMGFLMGPTWPAWQGLLCERYGVRLRARDMAFALAGSKVGMAGEQFLFSWVLADRSRGGLFGVGILGFLVACALLAVALLGGALPRSGLIRIDRPCSLK
jgi:MFS family permease